MASQEDVDGDGLLDLVVHFETQSLALSEGDELAALWGETSSGMAVRGTDSVEIVGAEGLQAAANALLAETGSSGAEESRTVLDEPPMPAAAMLATTEDDFQPVAPELTPGSVDAVWEALFASLPDDDEVAIEFDLHLLDEAFVVDLLEAV
jgi:hypothetical protein